MDDNKSVEVLTMREGTAEGVTAEVATRLYKKRVNLRVVLFALSILGTALMLYVPLRTVLMGTGSRSESDYIPVIPIMSAVLVYWRRDSVFADVRYLPSWGIPFMACGVGLYALGFAGLLPLDADVRISWLVFSGLVAFVGAFIFLFGTLSFRKARFPLLFLAFMIPVPLIILDAFIYALQVGSTEATDMLFSLIDVPYARNGFFFYFQGVAIEVAKQCSGIRSSMALIVTGVLAGHLFVDRSWKQILVILSIFPITVLKNAIRIVTLTLLAIYVDVSFLTDSFLHHSGGFLFYIPGLVLLGLEIWLLRSRPRRR